jgi:ABC-type multidrug transport system fused ATPase/permease subunit
MAGGGVRGLREAPVLVLARETARTAPGLTASLAIVVLVAAAVPLGLAVAAGMLVAALAGVEPGAAFPDRSITGVVVALGVLFLLLQLLSPLATAIAETLGRRVARAVSDRVLVAVGEPAGLWHVEEPEVGQVVASTEGGLVGTGMRDAVVGLATTAIMRGAPILGIGVLFAYRWWLGLALLVAYGYVMVTVSRTYQRALESAEGTPALMRRAMYLKDLLCTPAAGKEVRTFGLGGWVIGRYLAESRRGLGRTRAERGSVGLVSVVSGLVVLAGEAVTFLALAADVRQGELSVGAFTVFAVAAAGLVGIASVTPDLLNVTVGGTMLAGVRRLERRLADPGAAGGRIPPPLRGAIRFEDVGFRYPGSESWVLRHLDLTIRANTSLSVVGVNGAGKTTLVKLLCGLYRPTEGRILVDGVDLAELDQRAWQRRFAALFQDWLRWGLSVRDNVLLGTADRPADGPALDEVARAAGLREVLDRLPHGWDTVLSRDFDGVDLSGGEWQRVGLARALWAVGGGAEVLVLDEPTSALDVRGELELFDRLLAIAPGKTMILISHRFATVRHTDHIVVLADGRVAEQGGHAELMAAGGGYARMFALQADRFAAGAEGGS